MTTIPQNPHFFPTTQRSANMPFPARKSVPFYFRGQRSSVLFSGVRDFEAVSRQIAPIVTGIAREKHVRHVVLDSWCLVDFLLRRNLSLILGISKYEKSDFDPKFDLLPRSFEELLRCLESFHESQSHLPNDPDPFDLAVKIPTDLLVALYRDKEFGARFGRILDEYYAKKAPAVLHPPSSGTMILEERRPKNLSGADRRFLDSLDVEWFKKARRLNKARNLAAHTMDDAEVAQVLGISGPKLIDRVRRECLLFLKTLAGVKKPA